MHTISMKLGIGLAMTISAIALTAMPLVRLAMAGEKKAETIVIDEKMAGKTVDVLVGQDVEIRLKADRPMTGWETAIGIIGAKEKPALEYVSQKFEPDAKAADAAIGTQVFRYRGGKVGETPLRIAFVYPGGPNVGARLATQLVREFRVTIKVAAK